MFKSSFTVGYNHCGFETVVLGVTSIVPNLNGFLLFTEDGENFQIESYELAHNILGNVYFEYSTEEDIAEAFESAEKGEFLLIDHRKK